MDQNEIQGSHQDFPPLELVAPDVGAVMLRGTQEPESDTIEQLPLPSPNVAHKITHADGSESYLRHDVSPVPCECAGCQREIEPWTAHANIRRLDPEKWTSKKRYHFDHLPKVDEDIVSIQDERSKDVTDDRLNQKQREVMAEKGGTRPKASGIPRRRFHIFGPNGAQHIVPVDRD